MKNILILTKSLISEQALEQQLQQLDCEVYVSKQILENCIYDEVQLELIRSFDIILISETVSNNEMAWVLPCINATETLIIRKTDHFLSKDEKKEWMKQGIFGWIKTCNTLEELRESIDGVLSQKTPNSQPTNIISMRKRQEKRKFSTLSLTHKERKLLGLLFQADGVAVSREELSHKLWDQEPCNSTLTQLSTLTNRLKNKLAEQGIYGDTIQTVWGVGYKLLEDFYNQVYSDEAILSEM